MINPKLTQTLITDVLNKAKNGIYRVEIDVGGKIIPIDVYPEVFPPRTNYSISSQSLFNNLGNLTGMEVADIGCGTGVESIVAVLSGATHVDATDIASVAVECTKHNIKLNKLETKIDVYKGNLFDSLPRKKYDLIIANLPIVDFKPKLKSDIVMALYDPNLNLHKELLKEAGKFLSSNGTITFTHANLKSRYTRHPNKDFEVLELLIINHGYKIVKKVKSKYIDYEWINYKIELNTK